MTQHRGVRQSICRFVHALHKHLGERDGRQSVCQVLMGAARAGFELVAQSQQVVALASCLAGRRWDRLSVQAGRHKMAFARQASTQSLGAEHAVSARHCWDAIRHALDGVLIHALCVLPHPFQEVCFGGVHAPEQDRHLTSTLGPRGWV
eukprot:CAMPEP_0115366226 /NCGR_PEP_ID=MMETSP0270-20121206/104692_1 /TAXON_ID=71861 /ORGANISM="Scrippsiella trochoidea, Strain CCMP3099" /LENGTH=148 /DNA_ID=CAMNT_0002788983 /DNA_START=377 /DNA_END=819 /DNA_ORIENTATION=-